MNSESGGSDFFCWESRILHWAKFYHPVVEFAVRTAVLSPISLLHNTSSYRLAPFSFGYSSLYFPTGSRLILYSGQAYLHLLTVKVDVNDPNVTAAT